VAQLGELPFHYLTVQNLIANAVSTAQVNYYNIFSTSLPCFQQFHDFWKESICGPDKYGHMIQVLDIHIMSLLPLNSKGYFRMDLCRIPWNGL